MTIRQSEAADLLLCRETLTVTVHTSTRVAFQSMGVDAHHQSRVIVAVSSRAPTDIKKLRLMVERGSEDARLADLRLSLLNLCLRVPP